MKACNRCGVVKALDLFPKNKASPDGHYSLCKACRAVKSAEHRKKPEVIARESERLRKQYQANRAQLLEARKVRYASNREATLEQNRAWREAHLEQHREQCRQWAKDNPVAMRAIVARRRALILGAAGSHTKADVQRLWDEQGGFCIGCRVDLGATGYHVDHKHPLSKGGSNGPENLQLLCPTCNRKKSDKLDWAPSGL